MTPSRGLVRGVVRRRRFVPFVDALYPAGNSVYRLTTLRRRLVRGNARLRRELRKGYRASGNHPRLDGTDGTAYRAQRVALGSEGGTRSRASIKAGLTGSEVKHADSHCPRDRRLRR